MSSTEMDQFSYLGKEIGIIGQNKILQLLVWCSSLCKFHTIHVFLLLHLEAEVLVLKHSKDGQEVAEEAVEGVEHRWIILAPIGQEA